MDNRMSWYNYTTGEYDLLEAPATDDEAVQYIPQGAGVTLYTILREHRGLGIIEAIIEILTAATGERPEQPDLATAREA